MKMKTAMFTGFMQPAQSLDPNPSPAHALAPTYVPVARLLRKRKRHSRWLNVPTASAAGAQIAPKAIHGGSSRMSSPKFVMTRRK